MGRSCLGTASLPSPKTAADSQPRPMCLVQCRLAKGSAGSTGIRVSLRTRRGGRIPVRIGPAEAFAVVWGNASPAVPHTPFSGEPNNQTARTLTPSPRTAYYRQAVSQPRGHLALSAFEPCHKTLSVPYYAWDRETGKPWLGEGLEPLLATGRERAKRMPLLGKPREAAARRPRPAEQAPKVLLPWCEKETEAGLVTLKFIFTSG